VRTQVGVGPTENASERSDDGPRAGFIRACAEAIASGDVVLAKVAHQASGALLGSRDGPGSRVADLKERRRRSKRHL
jgi:hypothetical protein